MNNERRKLIENVKSMLVKAIDILETVSSDEETAMDNLPDSIRYSDRGDRMQECLDLLEEAKGNISDAYDNLEEIN